MKAWMRVSLVTLAIAASALASPLEATSDEEDDIRASVALNKEVIGQVANAVSNLIEADTKIRTQLTEVTEVLIESQNALLKVFGQSKSSGDVPAFEGRFEGLIKQLSDQIVSALRDADNRSNANKSVSTSRSSISSPVFDNILAELKSLNAHFARHLRSLACPPPFVMLGDECFNIILEDMSWPDARNACLRIGADLAQTKHINELKEYVGQTYPRKNKRNFWIGGIYREKVWQWLSGEPLDDGYWYTNEPSGNGECLAIFDGWDNPFTDFPCENERRAICKRDLH